MQYCSLKEANRLDDIKRRWGDVAAAADREVADLALDGAGVSSAAAGDDAFLQDLLDGAVVKGLFVSRGE